MAHLEGRTLHSGSGTRCDAATVWTQGSARTLAQPELFRVPLDRAYFIRQPRPVQLASRATNNSVQR